MQFEKMKENKSYHFNMEMEAMHEELAMSVKHFKQILIKSLGKDYQLRKKGEHFVLKELSNDTKVLSQSHNQKKKYLLEEGEVIDFLVYLGIMSKEGKVYKQYYNKFRQINKYLEFIENTIRDLEEKKYIQNRIRILDFGSGKSYLTFACYYYLKKIKEMDCEIIGLDLKEDVMAKCNRIAQDLGYEQLKFFTGNIKDFENMPEVDLVFSLHACDNATDDSILKALEMNAKAILAVPCCQHEFYHKLEKAKDSAFLESLEPLAKHGLLLERFASLATDAYRALFLESKGYKTQVMEFIDMEHTPKNVLIKGIYEGKTKSLETKKKEAEEFLEFLGIEALLK